LITSMARAVGRRRIKPRSSSAVMSRWMPDFERKSGRPSFRRRKGIRLLQTLMNEAQSSNSCGSAWLPSLPVFGVSHRNKS
jgi:hypothetical protein